MWTSLSVPAEQKAPCSRTKHSATLLDDHVYLYGGRNGNLPLKDMWKYSLENGEWEQLQPEGDRPPSLQEHTAVPYKGQIYIFGGELSFSAASETPLWIYNIKTNTWRKVKGRKGVVVPRGRRGHTALVHHGSMLMYGGYQDLRGSSNELWAFHFETESWHLFSPTCSADVSIRPPGRHKHSAVLHDNCMWIYGGMTDLVERNDLWRWDTVSKVWNCVKTKISPGPLHSHAACCLTSSMLLFGGESSGQPSNDVWRFHFATETWEKLQFPGNKPQPRAESIALSIADVQQTVVTHRNHENNNATTIYRMKNPSKSQEPPTILRELTQRFYNKCSYSALNSDSTESLLKSTDTDSTPVRMKKSQSACMIGANRGALTPVECNSRLVYLDSDDEGDGLTRNTAKQPLPSHSDSYSSHLVSLGGNDSWNKDEVMTLPKSASAVRFRKMDGGGDLTSDYCSIETISERKGVAASFSNPHYMGPKVEEKKDYAKMLASPTDSAIENSSIGSLELKKIRPKTVDFKVSRQVVYHPTTAPIEQRKRWRASSASRVERPSANALHERLNEEDLTGLCVFVVGGKARGQLTVFHRPISLWKLHLASSIH